VLAATAGTLVATGATLHPDPATHDTAAHLLVLDARPVTAGGMGGGVGGGAAPPATFRPELVGAARGDAGQLDRIFRGHQVATERAHAERLAQEAAEAAARDAAARDAAARQAVAREAADRAAQARRPLFVAPTAGRLTSTYGSRGGAMHWGIDIANPIGTPIVSAADGVVVEAGPASGFGLWVRVRHGDGTVTIYGHVDRTLVRTGQAVRAGQQIATMGNRGDSTGPHLHFEVWTAGGSKINPLTWLSARGVRI